MRNKKTVVNLVLLLLALLFIFAQSLLPPAASGKESDSVADALGAVFGTESGFAVFLLKYVRKIAHFCEFAVLGFFTALTLFAFRKHRNARFLLLGFLGGVAAAVSDECIQHFSGRNPAVLDVLIDVCGFCAAYLLVLLWFRIRKK